VLTERASGALRREKFFDINAGSPGSAGSGDHRRHGAGAEDARGVKKERLGTADPAAVSGLENLRRHIRNVKKFGVPVMGRSIGSSAIR